MSLKGLIAKFEVEHPGFITMYTHSLDNGVCKRNLYKAQILYCIITTITVALLTVVEHPTVSRARISTFAQVFTRHVDHP